MSRYMRQERTYASRSKTPVFTKNQTINQEKEKLWKEMSKPIRHDREKYKDRSSNFNVQNPNKTPKIATKFQIENTSKTPTITNKSHIENPTKKERTVSARPTNTQKN